MSALVSIAFVAALAAAAAGADWPMWRYGPKRGAASPEALPATLHPQWVRVLPPLRPAWPCQPRLYFDEVYQPVVAGKTLFVGSSANDSVVAYDTETGEEKWRFYAEGPVRFAPVAAGGRVYFVSDDGFLYCLKATDGSLVWKFRGGPADRKLLGNDRLISMWPARGGPVLVDGTVYFAAGIWPFMGVFIHALDAETGKVIWTNRSSNFIFSMVDHNLTDYVGVSPQGYFVVVGDKLIVPCGRSWPACFDRKSGKLLYFRQGQDLDVTKDKGWGARSWREGSWRVMANSRYIFNCLSHRARNYQYNPQEHRLGNFGGILDLNTGNLVQMMDKTNLVPGLVLTDDAVYGGYGNVRAYTNSPLKEVRAMKVTGGGFAVQVDGVPVPIKQATFTSAGPKSKTYRSSEMPSLLAVKKDYNMSLVKLDLSRLPSKQPKKVVAAMLISWVLAPGKPATVTFHRMLRDWDQQACWKWPFADEREAWNGLRKGVDYAAEPFAVMKCPAALRNQVHEIEGFGRAIAKWASGEWKNFGFVMIIDGPAIQINFSLPRGKPARISMGTALRLDELWRLPVRADVLIKAGGRLYAASPGEIKAIDIPAAGGTPKVSWSAKVEGKPRSLLAADGKLFAVTVEGRIYCFGPKKVKTKVYGRAKRQVGPSDESSGKTATAILDATGVKEGYCVLLGAPSGRVVDELARRSKLRIFVMEPDAKKAAALRARLDSEGLHPKRVAVAAVDPSASPLPPYMASLIVVDHFPPAWPARALFRSLRPYGGLLCARIPASRQREFADWAAKGDLPGAEVSRAGDFALLKRSGPLPGAGQWTHEYADEARTMSSGDALVKPPFGVLWFGGPSESLFARPFFVPRYYPSPQVVGGRLFGQSLTSLYAVDVYTGRLLWRAPLPDPGKIYDVYRIRVPGYTFVSRPDCIYVACGELCLRFSPETGRKLGEFRLPGKGRIGEKPTWAHISVWKDVLIASAVIPNRFWENGYAKVRKEDLTTRELAKLTAWVHAMNKAGKIKRRKGESRGAMYERVMNEILAGENLPASFPKELRDAIRKRGALRLTSSDRIVAMDRHTGRVLWTRDAVWGFTDIDNQLGNPRFGSVAVGAGRVYLLDTIHEHHYKMLKRRGRVGEWRPKLLALDARTGRVLWTIDVAPLGVGWVAYSVGRDVVLAGHSGNITAFRGGDGKKLWHKNIPGNTFSRPSTLHDDVVITMFMRGDLTGKSLFTDTNTMYREWIMQSLETGEVTGRFKAPGAYCGFGTACAELLLFRSTSTALYDFKTGRVRNLAGFRTGCSNNLIPADGVLSIPHFGWHCMCNYPIFTAAALVHMNEAETWAAMGPQKNRSFDKRIPSKK